jgi:transposase
MSLATATLPTDPDALRAFAARLQAELYAKSLHIEKLKAELALLKRARYGRSSERIEQLELLIGELEADEAEHEAKEPAAAPDKPRSTSSPPRGRQPLPAHLPRERVEHEAACACPACGSTRLSRIGADEREILEYVPSHFKVVVHVRPKLSCRQCETITQPPLPSLPIERGRPGPALLAHVLVAKYVDHSPLHRQSTIYARAGVELDRSTLADWVGHGAALLQALADGITRHAKAGTALHADDTPVPVLDPGRQKTKMGRLWVLVRDERPWGGPAPPAVTYLYSPDRKGEHAQALLTSCRGFLHADGYAGFNRLYQPAELAPLTEVGCPPRPAGRVPSRNRIDGLLAIDGRMPAANSTTSTPPPTRRSPGRPSNESASSSRSRPRSTATSRRTASPPARSFPCRSSTRSGPSSSNPWPRSAARAAWLVPSATASPAGRRSAGSPATAASR